MATTVAFDRSVKGWTSEYSFTPDSGLSLNNNFYTFKEGRIWLHNVESAQRNTWYRFSYATELQLIFNDERTSTKNFKTLKFQGEGEKWSAEVETNLESGTISQTNFIDKEGNKLAFIRGANQVADLDVKSSSVGGIGVATTGTGSTSINFDTSIPSAISERDLIYKVSPVNSMFNSEPVLVGVVGAIRADGIDLTTNVDITGTETLTDAVTGDFIMYAKDNRVEKSGLIGFYAIVTLTHNDVPTVDDENVEAAELFAVQSEVFISSK